MSTVAMFGLFLYLVLSLVPTVKDGNFIYIYLAASFVEFDYKNVFVFVCCKLDRMAPSHRY